MGLSLLIFSINEAEEVMSLAKEMQRTVDEIIVIDSSYSKKFRLLNRKKAEEKMDKMKIFHAPALGYAEPFRAYGISKCRNDWILLLDTDERLSTHLRLNIRKIIGSADFNVMQIKRYEHVNQKGGKSNFFTWQVRLFRKNSVEFLGLTHETPKMIGRVKKLESESEYINHMDELRHTRYYNKMDLFSQNNPAILILRDLMIGLLNGEMNLDYFTSTFKTHLDIGRQRTEETIAISNIIRTKGLIKYLKLDSERTIKRLDRKYSGKKQGIDLLIKLLKDRYSNKYP
ncbi:MAG: hypothetical protein KGH49_01605 [Candidatus Micrarchaeota archaeon]|nr:hypothetical protein [Candidatus Micrarchaeota archaeon]